MPDKELFKLDKNKIKEEDRRFLMNRNFNEIIASYQGSTHNTAITLSLLAVLISTFSVVYSTKNLILILIFSIFSLGGLITYIKKVQKNLSVERKKMIEDYDRLFEHHFSYSKQK